MTTELGLRDLGLTIPSGITHDGIMHVGRNVETAGSIVAHFFTFKKGDKQLQVRILAEAGMSRAQIEESASGALERWLGELAEQEQKNVGKHKPSPSERREIGKAIRDFREHAAKRRESTGGKLYYSGGIQ